MRGILACRFPRPSLEKETPMTPVTIQGKPMSAANAAQIIVSLIEHMPGDKEANLKKALDDLCEPETRFTVHDAVYMNRTGSRLN